MINKKTIHRLASQHGQHCLSIYIPTHRAGRNQEDALRFKNSIRDAHGRLVGEGMTTKRAHQFLKGAYELLDDDQFWLRLSDGLAVFITENSFEYFLLPSDVNPFVALDTSFYVRPLFPVITGRQRFFLLVLSQNEVRFFEGNKHSITPVIIDDLVPENMEEALALDYSGLNLQSHTGGGRSPIFHGRGKDDKLIRLRQYFQQVDDGLMQMLHDEDAPMIIGAVDYLVPIYREISKYDSITNIHIHGNLEQDDPVLLHEKAWSIIKMFNKNELAYHKQTFAGLAAERKASTEISDILWAALNGKVETIFVHKDKHLYGSLNRDNREIVIPAGPEDKSEDLLEIAAKATFLQGGKVYHLPVSDMPKPQYLVNAIMRYA